MSGWQNGEHTFATDLWLPARLWVVETFNLWKTLLEYRGQIRLKALS